MPVKSTKSEKKVAVRKVSKRDNVELVIKEKSCPDVYDEPEELVVPVVVPDVVPVLEPAPVEEEEPAPPQVEEQSVAEELVEPLCSSLQEEEVEGQLVLEELLEKSKKTRVLKEGKPLVNETGEYLNPLTNRYVKVGTTLYKKLIKDGMICVVPV